MNSRERILNQVTANKPSALPLPELPAPELLAASLDKERFVKIQKFRTILEGIGGKVVEVDNSSAIAANLSVLKQQGLKVACLCPGVGEGNLNITARQSAAELESIDTAFISASFGVAENGSVWLYESRFINRLLPFICQHLFILLDAGAILLDMHEAYRHIEVDKEGYGLFIAGPSKTADIEQSLVIGAHGARSCTVYLLNETAL
ncbi:LutC/YkgG family protein [Flavitalea sp.]|nr:LUD domain-containing protein [Flavitalea sp.]